MTHSKFSYEEALNIGRRELPEYLEEAAEQQALLLVDDNDPYFGGKVIYEKEQFYLHDVESTICTYAANRFFEGDTSLCYNPMLSVEFNRIVSKLCEWFA